MQWLIWNEDLNTGIPEIDGQHRRMLELINQIHYLAWRRGAGAAIYYGGAVLLPPLFPEEEVYPSRVLAAIEDVLAYTLEHFSFEEAVMQDAGFPLSAEHCRSHDAFRLQVEEVLSGFQRGIDVLEELCSLLCTWFFRHIAHDDRDLAALRQAQAGHGHACELPEIVAGAERR